MTDQITIPSALLKQALESLWQMTKKFNFERLHESRLSDSNVRVSAHDAMNAIRAELAKPVEQQLPAWHDAPTCAGLWLCNYGILEVVCINQPDVDNFDDFYNAGGRWYGPIPQDAKAEGDAIKKGG